MIKAVRLAVVIVYQRNVKQIDKHDWAVVPKGTEGLESQGGLGMREGTNVGFIKQKTKLVY